MGDDHGAVAGGHRVGESAYLVDSERHDPFPVGWRHAFEEHHVGRVAIKTDLRNKRSQRAIAKLGAVRGVWRNHRRLSTGKCRDSVFYSVIDPEWPAVRRRLSSVMLLAANSAGCR